jgi:hypothetical protein
MSDKLKVSVMASQKLMVKRGTKLLIDLVTRLKFHRESPSQALVVIHGYGDFLFRTEVALRCLN